MPKAGFGSFEFNPDLGFYHTADLNKTDKTEGSPASRALQALGKAAGQGHAANGAGMGMESKMSMANRVTPRPAPGSKSRPDPGMMPKAAPGKTTDMAHAKQATVRKNAGLALDFSPNSILNGIILSEILGKPKCMKNTFRK